MKKKVISEFLLYWAPRVLSLVFGLFIFIFSLFSGSEEYGGGFTGVLKNSPNALPWAVLLGIVYLAWKNDKIGGYFFLAFGILSVLFFKTWQDLIVFLIVSFPMLLVGGLFLLNYYDKGK